MSQFTTPAVLELLDNYRWRLVEPFEYFSNITDIGTLRYPAIDCVFVHRGEDGNITESAARKIEVPIGYITDLTSIPRFLWSIFPPHGKYAKAAIVHDYLYTNAIGTKAWADEVFFEAMGVLSEPRWRKYLMYWSVRLFGRGRYE